MGAPVIRWLECAVVADFTRGARGKLARIALLAFFVAEGHAGIHFVEMSLEAFF